MSSKENQDQEIVKRISPEDSPWFEEDQDWKDSWMEKYQEEMKNLSPEEKEKYFLGEWRVEKEESDPRTKRSD